MCCHQLLPGQFRISAFMILKGLSSMPEISLGRSNLNMGYLILTDKVLFKLLFYLFPRLDTLPTCESVWFCPECSLPFWRAGEMHVLYSILTALLQGTSNPFSYFPHSLPEDAGSCVGTFSVQLYVLVWWYHTLSDMKSHNWMWNLWG